MNKREKTMLIMILSFALIFVHIWGIKKYLVSLREKQNEVASLQLTVDNYRNSGSIAELLKEDVKWLEQHEPQPSTFGAEQSKLLDFLKSSGLKNGITAEQPQLSPMVDTGGKYQRAKIQIQATAKEDQIYRWLSEIHQPSKFRAVTQLVMRPSSNIEEDEKIVCTLVAEQWLINTEEL